MSSEKPGNNKEPEDHGEIVEHPRARISWAWLFPLLAAAACAWLFWTDWKSNGPEIEVEFESAPGIQPGKTPLIYRGVVAGKVTSVRLSPDLGRVVLMVRLKAFASELAREGTIFWIDQPVVGLGDTSGLDALIQGNSLQARIGSGAPATKFVGRNRVPLTPLESPSLKIHLRAGNIPYLDRGAGIFRRGVQVGFVEDKTLDESGRPYLSVLIEKEFAGTVHENARFWPVPAASLSVGHAGLKLNLTGLKTVLLGGVEFETFGEPGKPVTDGAEFTLYTDQAMARATGNPVQIRFRNGQGIVAGQTEVRYLGVSVGFVETARVDVANQAVDVTVRFQPEFDRLHDAGAIFTLVQPKISLDGVSGIETLVSGPYIDCAPGPGETPAWKFAGRSLADENLLDALAEREGVHLTLHAKNLPSVGSSAPILFRGLVAGRVKRKVLGENNEPYLEIVIRKEFAPAVTGNARFWNVPATSVQAGPGLLNIDVASLETLVQGGIAFDAVGSSGTPVEQNSQFELFATEAAARAISPPVRVTFEQGQGLLAGRTEVRYLGVPVGLVESVTTRNELVEAVVRLNDGYDFLRREGTAYSVIRLSISLNGVSGLETAVSGVYIDCVAAGGGKLTDRFRGVSQEKEEFLQEEERGFEIVVTSPQTNISVDAPVSYRGLVVGKVGRKVLASDGRGVGLAVVISKPYDQLIRENTKFWDSGGVKVSMGFLAINVQSTSLDALAHGGISFATPDSPGAKVRRGHEFPLYKEPRKEWLKWAPEFPAGR